MLKVGFVSLGCPKNLVDSEILLGRIVKEGFILTPNPEEADIIIVNTCAFIDSAKEEAINAILRMAEYKTSGNCRRLLVTGCLAQRYGNELKKEMPEIDIIFSLDDWERAGELCRNDNPSEKNIKGAMTFLHDHSHERILTTPRYTAFLKIAEGCSHRCSFCVIPDIRGKFRSRAAGSLEKEAEALAEKGVREIILIAQDTTVYGTDLGKKDLPGLLKRLANVNGIEWLRIMYFYPGAVTDELLNVIGQEDKICKYVDIPLQHVSCRILGSMKRPGNREEYSKLIDRIRKRVPGIAIRSSFITGYPGETKKEFSELLAFCREIRFDNLGVFTYSPQEGTVSARLKDGVPEMEKEQRRDELMELQSEISFEINKQWTGKKVKVLCEGKSNESEFLLQGRTQGQAPDIDGRVLITDGEAEQGEFVTVEIEDAFPYDMAGKIVR